MANNYGIANLGLIIQEPFQAGDVACPAGTETTIMSTTAMKGTDPSGVYLPWVFFNIAILLGATPPTALKIAAKIGAGADFNSYNVAPAVLVANATLSLGLSMVGGASIAPWQGAGSIINLTVNPTGQAVTAKGQPGYADVFLFRGPDQ